MAFVFVLMSFAICAACQVFNFQTLPTAKFPGLQVDRDGNAYLSTGRQVYRLNSDLQLEETRNLTSDSLNISLSSNGKWLVVRLTDLSCEVYNATNLSAQPVFRRENAIRSTENVALFAADDSFYVGSIATGIQPQITLGQYRFSGAAAERANYDITLQDFERNFYGGFVTTNYAYYFAVDNSPVRVRGIRVIRICHNSNFNALHELTLGCGGRTPSYNTRISGISFVHNLAGVMEPTVILSRNRPASSQNYVCLYNLSMIDSIMLEKYQSCSAAVSGTREQLDLAWRTFPRFCDEFLPAQNTCQFRSSIPLALDDIDSLHYNGRFQIHLVQKFITSSVAVVLESFSFVFVSYTDINGSSFIAGFDVGGRNYGILLFDHDAFGRRMMPSPVAHLQWQSGSDSIYAVSASAVMKIPVADCTSHINCTSCLGDGNPLCGWCLLENKCSQKEECRNFNVNWIPSNKTNTTECLTISVSPSKFVVNNPQTITVSLSRSLPTLLEDNTYKCLFANNNGTNFTVEAVGYETTYFCNISIGVPMNQRSLVTVVFVSLVSSLTGVPFARSTTPFFIYHCERTTICSDCLQTNNACGWCVYNKVCSGTADPCIDEHDGYLKVNLAINQNYTGVCPLLDKPVSGESYLQPVQVSRNLQILARNLPPEIDEFKYKCVVNGIVLPAVYISQTLLICVVHEGKLILGHGIGQQTTDITVYWTGNYQGKLINHQIDKLVPVNVTLYDCAELASCCSSCLFQNINNGFECGWCDRSTFIARDNCSYVGECDSTVVKMSSDCPAPTITNFSPKSGHIEGGTTITITGTELGVTFSDFTANSISIGNDICLPITENNFISGKQILCRTVKGSPGGHVIMITLPSGVTFSNEEFNFALPEIYGVDPMVGPVAGGTELKVWGSNLNIGNIENTRVHLIEGIGECIIHDQTSIQERGITCVTSSLTSPMEGTITILIDQSTVTNISVHFNYMTNPTFINVIPSTTIIAGGTTLIFKGTNLDIVQRPVLQITEYPDGINMTRCTVINSTAISCVTPPLTRLLPGDSDGLNYTIIMDNAPGPDPTMDSLQISVLPNPSEFLLITLHFDQTTNGTLQIAGDNLHSVPAYEIRVQVGGEPCVITAVDVYNNLLFCTPPSESPEGIAKATVTVFIGAHLRYILSDKFNYDQSSSSNTLTTISAISVTSVVVIISVVVSMTLATVILLKTYKIKVNKKRDHTKALKRHYDNLLPMSSSSLPVVNASSHLNQTSQVSPPLFQVSQKLIIPGKHLHILNKKIGQGEFGEVYEAQLLRWKGRGKKLTVAVKTLKYLHSDSDKEKMIAEINKMENLQHPNVMPLIGVCFDAGNGISIVMPFMANGSLLSYLKKQRANIYLKRNTNPNTIMSVKKLLLRMCHQVVKGMEYLAMKGFVHRDLAGRNCLLDSKGSVRVGDFGLAEDIYTKGYFRQGKNEPVKLPFKWMAPESLRDGVFSEKSDVWSFGITCWEVFSGGRIPYSAVDAISILTLHESGTRLDKPENAACATEEYSIMVKCWALNPEDRPSFKQLRESMDELLQTAAGYLELKMVLLSPKNDESTDESGYEITENPFKEDFQCLTITNPLALSSQGKRTEDEHVSTEDSNMKKMSAFRASESSTPCAVVTANCTNEIGDDVA